MSADNWPRRAHGAEGPNAAFRPRYAAGPTKGPGGPADAKKRTTTTNWLPAAGTRQTRSWCVYRFGVGAVEYAIVASSFFSRADR
jgi:hypothetical protein